MSFDKRMPGKNSRRRERAGAAPTVVALAVAALMTSGCGADRLTKLRASPMLALTKRGAAQASFQSLAPEGIGNRYKFLFIVDESGSNCANVAQYAPESQVPPACLTTATDPTQNGNDTDGSRRFDPITSFVDQQNPANVSGYGLIWFNSQTGIVKGGASSHDFTPDQNAFKSLVASEKINRRDRPTNSDRGNLGTNYEGALSNAENVIAADLARCAATPTESASTYIIFFISDGEPNQPEGYSQDQLVTRAQSAVDRILNLSNTDGGRCANGIYLHSGYYYSADSSSPAVAPKYAAAKNAMQKIAETGKGDSLEFGPGTQIDLAMFRIPQVTIQMKLVNVFVKNMNVVWEGGIQKLDSDGDGLSDELELKLGSNSGNSDSDGNGLSDFIEYRVYKSPCGDLQCKSARARDTSSCSSARISPLGSFPAVFMDSDGDGLNDCEEGAIRTRKDRWDSNGNNIPDLLEFMTGDHSRGMNPMSGADESDEDPDNDGLTNKEEIKRGTPIYTNNSLIINFKPYDYTLDKTERMDGIDYTLDIREIPLIGAANGVRIYLVESSSGVRDVRFLRIAQKTVTLEGGTQFSNEDFGVPGRFECSATDPCN